MFKDFVHKNVSPETYLCSLCTITWDNLGMKREWKQFVNSLDREVEFLHRDELAKDHGITDVHCRLHSCIAWMQNLNSGSILRRWFRVHRWKT